MVLASDLTMTLTVALTQKKNRQYTNNSNKHIIPNIHK